MKAKNNTEALSSAVPSTAGLGDTCRKCGGLMKRGIAIEQTWVSGLGDYIGDRHGITLSPSGSGALVGCMKCKKCGHSVA
jgi:hypothetical protein